MAKVQFLVFTAPVAGQEAEYNRWYDDVHLADVLKVRGFVSAQRFQAVGDCTMPGRFLAIYEVETDDPADVLAELSKVAGTQAMPLSPALDMTKIAMATFVPITTRRTGSN